MEMAQWKTYQNMAVYVYARQGEHYELKSTEMFSVESQESELFCTKGKEGRRLLDVRDIP